MIFFAKNSVYYLSRAVSEKEKGACHSRHRVRNAEIFFYIDDIRAIAQLSYVRTSVNKPANQQKRRGRTAHFVPAAFFFFFADIRIFRHITTLRVPRPLT